MHFSLPRGRGEGEVWRTSQGASVALARASGARTPRGAVGAAAAGTYGARAGAVGAPQAEGRRRRWSPAEAATVLRLQRHAQWRTVLQAAEDHAGGLRGMPAWLCAEALASAAGRLVR